MEMICLSLEHSSQMYCIWKIQLEKAFLIWLMLFPVSDIFTHKASHKVQ